ncbi:MFS transporter [uncultured Propionivibrio sp.]|uniref:MFS transporter n=1 Tax=uncultured Propionivibrio sp. TaxID=426737 RepID=UPI0029C019F3|nr:MFS transporter [uncultured Propionivibrio sp.]
MSERPPASPTPPTPPAQPQPLTGGQLVLGTVALSLATFMNVLDSSIANVSIPAIAGDFGVSPNQGTWVITSFAVSNAIAVPLTGWLTQRFGMVRLFTLSTALFVLASFLCGLAPSLGLLIFFRILQGLVAGPMIPLSQALLLQSYPRTKAGIALALWSMTTPGGTGHGAAARRLDHRQHELAVDLLHQHPRRTRVDGAHLEPLPLA